MNETRKTAEQNLLKTGILVLFPVVKTHTEVSPGKENVFTKERIRHAVKPFVGVLRSQHRTCDTLVKN